MDRYSYSFQSVLRFDAAVGRHFFKLRCVPCVNSCQRILSKTLSLHPAVCLTEGMDALGNGIQYGHTLAEHDAFVFCSYGVVALEDYRLAEDVHPMYRQESGLTPVNLDMMDWARDAVRGVRGEAERALALSEAVNGWMTYVAGATDNRTTALNAFSSREGVCQDYAHLLISLCRAQGMAARYVNGFIEGVGATHAWAEVYDGEAWIGLDPTNNVMIKTGYIKIAHGRDANDCPVNRGMYIGGCAQESEIRVLVERKG